MQISPQTWPALSALLDEALALPVQERATWVESLQGEHAALKDTLRELLARADGVETEDFLATLPRFTRVASANLGGPLTELAAGESIGPYRLISELGTGGMGAVWLAERADGTLKRKVAVKLPRLVWAKGLAERMGRERDILASLEHPNIARLYDAGVDQHGRPYLALEYVEGQPIDVYAKERGLGVKDKLQLLLQVCSAVAFAHSRLVVHRDLKPSNILVTGDGQVRLLDFGIAKLMEGDSAKETQLTQLAGRALTLDYASPEQIKGEPIGTASDVYSLGVVAYELLTGAKPYRLKRGSAAELEEAIATADAAKASDAAADTQTKKALKGDLDAILNKALKKLADERYATITALGEDWQRWMRRAPVRAQPDRVTYRLRKFVRRNAVAVAAGTAVASTVAVAALVSIDQAADARAQARKAAAAVDQQAAVRELYVEAMNTLAATASSKPADLAQPHAVSHTLWSTMKDMLGRYADRPPEREALLQAVMLQLSFTGDFEGALEVGQQYLAHLKKHGAAAHDVIDAHAAVARSLDVLGRQDDGIALLREGIAWAPGERSKAAQRTRLNIASELGGRLLYVGELTEAAKLLHDVEVEASKSFPGSRERADNLLRLARMSGGIDDAAALRYAERAHEVLLASGTANRDALLFSQAHVAAALALNGRLAEAADRYRQAYDLSVETYGRTDRDTIGYFGQWMGVLAAQGKHEVARSALLAEMQELQVSGSPDRNKTLALLKARAAENEMLFGDVRAALGWISSTPQALLSATHSFERLRLVASEAQALLMGGRAADGLNWTETALEGLSPGQRQLSPAVSVALVRVMALNAADRNAEANEAIRAIVTDLQRRGATRTWSYVVALELAALTNAAAKRPDDAASALALAAAAAESLSPPELALAESLLRRARVHALLDKRQQAEELAARARDLLTKQHPDSPRVRDVARLLAR
jgi:serine/threonine-protein kinase